MFRVFALLPIGKRYLRWDPNLENGVEHAALTVSKDQSWLFLSLRGPFMLTDLLSFTGSHSQTSHSLEFGFGQPFFHSAESFATRLEF